MGSNLNPNNIMSTDLKMVPTNILSDSLINCKSRGIISKTPNRQSKDKNLEKERFEIDRKPQNLHKNYIEYVTVGSFEKNRDIQKI